MSTATPPSSRDPAGSGAAAVDSISKYDAAYRDQLDFVDEPNRFLAECIKRIAGSVSADTLAGQSSEDAHPAAPRALDIGVGQGRNAVLLAQAGFDTFGIDRSEVGVQATRQRAAARGLAITVDVADSTTYDFGHSSWDVVVMLYYPAPMLVIERIKRALRPGGHIIVERFSQPKNATGADLAESTLPSPMLQAFVDWHVLHYEHDVFSSDWHWRGESPTGPIVRVLARKPCP